MLAQQTCMRGRKRPPITQYYDGRLYLKALLASRPKDLVSLVFFYQINSPYLVDNLNTLHDVGTYGKPETWSATFGYLATRDFPSLGLNYTANPSQTFYFGPSKANPSQRFEGNALLPGSPFYNVLTEDGRARRQDLVMQWCVTEQ